MSRGDVYKRQAPPETTAITLTNAAKPKERTPFALDAQSLTLIHISDGTVFICPFIPESTV